MALIHYYLMPDWQKEEGIRGTDKWPIKWLVHIVIWCPIERRKKWLGGLINGSLMAHTHCHMMPDWQKKEGIRGTDKWLLKWLLFIIIWCLVDRRKRGFGGQINGSLNGSYSLLFDALLTEERRDSRDREMAPLTCLMAHTQYDMTS